MSLPTVRGEDRKSTRLNSSHTVIYTLSLHDALPISCPLEIPRSLTMVGKAGVTLEVPSTAINVTPHSTWRRSEEHTSELQSHRDLHSFPTRRSSDLLPARDTEVPYDGRKSRRHAGGPEYRHQCHSPQYVEIMVFIDPARAPVSLCLRRHEQRTYQVVCRGKGSRTQGGIWKGNPSPTGCIQAGQGFEVSYTERYIAKARLPRTT